VPEIEHQRALADGWLRSFFAGDADAQGGADEADEAVSGGDDEAERDSLAEGEAGGCGGCGFVRGGGGFRHAVIVTGPEEPRCARRTAEGGVPT
jgi:hypothetical protein